MNFQQFGIDRRQGYERRLLIAFWLYFALLIFEGALRKWVLPELSSLFLVTRDPIALFAILYGIKYKLLGNGFCRFFIAISITTFFTTLLFGHGNIFVALYGFRVYGINAPAIFVWASILKKEDLRRLAMATMWLLVMMTAIIILQYGSPQESWINMGIGGNKEGGGFYGVGEYFRPSGTFSFASGLAAFEFLACACLLCFISETKKLCITYKRLGVFITVYLVSIFFCLSRTVATQTALLTVVFLIASLTDRKRFLRALLAVIAIFVIMYVLYMESGAFRLAVCNLFLRFDEASDAEGEFIKGSVGNRYIGSFVRAFVNPQNFTGQAIPEFGFGMGAGSKVGSILLHMDTQNSFSLAEEEWSLVVDENGYLLGGMILIIGRLLFPLTLLWRSLINKRCHDNSFCLFFTVTFFAYSMTMQLSIPTHLGFYTIIGAVALASVTQCCTKKGKRKWLQSQQ